jgi:hypothetical protein
MVTTKGYVYFFYCEGYCKIGLSNNPVTRISTLQIGTPFQLENIMELEFSSYFDAQKTESKLHKKFKSCNHRGEWFKLTGEDFKWVKSNYKSNLKTENLPEHLIVKDIFEDKAFDFTFPKFDAEFEELPKQVSAYEAAKSLGKVYRPTEDKPKETKKKDLRWYYFVLSIVLLIWVVIIYEFFEY